MPRYIVRKSSAQPELKGQWHSSVWRSAETALINNFHPQSVSRHPAAAAKMLRHGDNLHILFQVQDQHVMAKCENHQDGVCRDSCVEAFLQPKEGGSYLNFEVNCGGVILLYHIWDWTRTDKGFKGYAPVDAQWLDRIGVYHSLPKKIDPPIAEPATWQLELRIPLALFDAHTGPLGEMGGQTWRGNFYKCGGDPAFDHWAAWSPVDELNFHQPKHFGEIHFEA